MSFCPNCGSSTLNQQRCNYCASQTLGTPHQAPSNGQFNQVPPFSVGQQYSFAPVQNHSRKNSGTLWILLQVGTWFIIGSEFLSLLSGGAAGIVNASLAIVGVLVMLIVAMHTDNKAWIMPMLMILLLDDLDESLAGYSANLIYDLLQLIFYVSLEIVLIVFWNLYLKDSRRHLKR